MKNRAVIFANGNLSNIDQAKKIIKNEDILIAADGAVEHILKLDLIPTIIIGDFDSTTQSLIKKIKKLSRGLINQTPTFVKYPRKKNKTDFELAIDYCLKNKFEEIIIFGVLGDRIDHYIANILLLTEVQSNKKAIKIKVIEGKKDVYVLNKNIEIKGRIGDELSIIPVNSSLEGVITTGLEYTLNNESLFLGSTRGISNVFINNLVTIKIKKGTALVVHLRK